MTNIDGPFSEGRRTSGSSRRPAGAPGSAAQRGPSAHVMRSTLVIFVLLFGIAANAADLTPVPDLESPSANDQTRVSEIREIGFRWWFKNRGLLAEESFRVAGYFSVTRPIAEFAARGDRVWEVRVVHLHTGGPSGVLWINDKTERVIGLGGEDKGQAEPVAPPHAAPSRR
jgi:hypothetical protein